MSPVSTKTHFLGESPFVAWLWMQATTVPLQTTWRGKMFSDLFTNICAVVDVDAHRDNE